LSSLRAKSVFRGKLTWISLMPDGQTRAQQ
jgi:hypothetical protein